MTHRSRSADAAGEPMVIDRGRRGLEQSLHHPNAGASQFTRRGRAESAAVAAAGGTEASENEVYSQIAGLIPHESLGKVWELVLRVADAREARVRSECASIASTRATEKSIEERIAARITKAVEDGIGAGSQRASATWAEIARTPPASAPSLPTTYDRRSVSGAKPLRQRTEREITVRTRDAPDDIKGRTIEQTVQAANRARGGDAVVAARRLPSGDTVLVFRTAEDAGSPLNSHWIKTAFGEGVTYCRPLYAVVAKRVRNAAAAPNTETLAKEITQQNGTRVERVSKMRNRGGTAAFTTLVLSVATPEEANRLCEKGMILAYEIYDCEPYEEAAQPKQCYNCFRFGHISRYCRERARCGRCGAAAHADADCPAMSGNRPKCLSCEGAHAAWDRICPEVQKQRAIAREAYARRATRFATRAPSPLPPAPFPVLPSGGTEAPARGPGRPRGSTNKRARVASGQQRSQSAAPTPRPQSALDHWVQEAPSSTAPETARPW